MDDLFFDKDHAAAQLVRVTNAQDALEEKGLLGGLHNFCLRPEGPALRHSRPLVDMLDAKVFNDEADFMQRPSRSCARSSVPVAFQYRGHCRRSHDGRYYGLHGV
jgi:hypothetical protein